jgi:serine/threonine-protein kinase RsbW
MTLARVELSLESRIENLPAVGAAVRGIAERNGFGETRAYHAELCAVEAVTNAIEHAYGGRPGARVEIALAADEGRIEIRVRSKGVRLAAGRLAAAEAPDPLEERGRGLFLIRSLADEVETRADGGIHELRMLITNRPENADEPHA